MYYDGFFIWIALWSLIMIIILLPLLWAVFSNYHKNANRTITWKTINNILFVLSIILIIYYTLLRREYYQQEVILRPFRFVWSNEKTSELLKEMVLNILLFVPFGLSISELTKGKITKRLLTTIVVSIIVSIIIETLQYQLGVGWTETDDVICNVFGALLGASSLLWEGVIKRII